MPEVVFDEDVPEVRFPRKPPQTGNIKDLELYSGQCTIELERLDARIEILNDLLDSQGIF